MWGIWTHLFLSNSHSLLLVHLLKSQSTKAPRSKPTSFRGTGGKFTVKRTEQNVYDHIQRVENMRKTIETHLDMELPDDILPALSDGVVLCNFLNYVHPQTVAAVHSPASGLVRCYVPAPMQLHTFTLLSWLFPRPLVCRLAVKLLNACNLVQYHVYSWSMQGSK
jgi:hypothetical protein